MTQISRGGAVFIDFCTGAAANREAGAGFIAAHAHEIARRGHWPHR